jgi:hypothetical protein
MFGCMCIGLLLIHSSYKKQLDRIYEDNNTRRLVDTTGTEIHSREKPQILIPILVVFLIALLITPIVAVSYSLANEGERPKYPATPHPPAFAYEKPRKPLQERQQSGRDNIQTGTITTSPCSSTQVGHDNTSTVTCAPPSRVLPQQKAIQLKNDLSLLPKMFPTVFHSGTSSDVQTVFEQLCDALASLQPNCDGLNGTSLGMSVPMIQGIKCYSPSWTEGAPALMKAALDKASFPCIYIDGTFHGATPSGAAMGFGGVVILIGTNPAEN